MASVVVAAGRPGVAGAGRGGAGLLSKAEVEAAQEEEDELERNKMKSQTAAAGDEQDEDQERADEPEDGVNEQEDGVDEKEEDDRGPAGKRASVSTSLRLLSNLKKQGSTDKSRSCSQRFSHGVCRLLLRCNKKKKCKQNNTDPGV
eukprot:g2690.t1